MIAQSIVTDETPGRLLLGAVLGATTGYVAGGILGRSVATLIGLAERQLARLPGADLVAGTLGGVMG
ncbi:MAG TPA: hypothetical protein VM841_02215, partial [Actinomycetota bacterium]|nr:hypothetical protein [Actinomycetota bacterium]